MWQCPGWDAIERGGSARPAPKQGAPAGLSGEAAWAKSDPRPRASGRDGPEHPAAVPEVPRHCPPLRTTANGRILAPIAQRAYHLADRDRWIGWSEEQTMQRRHFVVQNSRFLVLPVDRPKGLASRVLSRCVRRLSDDWHRRFGFAPLLAETFVDPAHFRGTSYKAAGWTAVGKTRGFRRMGGSSTAGTARRKISSSSRCAPTPGNYCGPRICRSSCGHTRRRCQQSVAARLGFEGLRSVRGAAGDRRSARRPGQALSAGLLPGDRGLRGSGRMPRDTGMCSVRRQPLAAAS